MTKIKLAVNGKVFSLHVYDDTTLNWVFNFTIAFYRGEFNLLSGERSVSITENPFLCFKKFGSDEPLICPTTTAKTPTPITEKDMDSIIYLSLSGQKTIREVKVMNGDVLNLCHVLISRIDSHSKGGNVGTGKRSKQKRTSNSQVSYSKQEPDLTKFRELHSKAMTPVFDELRPQLKAIRDKLNSLLLKNDLPKKQKRKEFVAGKKNISIPAICERSIEGSLAGKAGKTVYQIFVGDSNNLYKTKSIKLIKTMHTLMLDLHGYSKVEARDMLNKCLPDWVELAMRGGRGMDRGLRKRHLLQGLRLLIPF